MTDAFAIAPHGYNALFSQPGVEPRRAKRRRHKEVNALAQLEAYVSSATYTPDGADALATRLKASGQPGELISPGVRRIRGNLCNVHGRYGPCDKALSGKKPAKGRKPRVAAKPKQTPEQRAAARDTQHQANIDSVAKRMADTDTGLSPSGVKALTAFAKGEQPDATQGPGLAKMGLAEQASDGSYRMTPTGRAAVAAMQAGDYQRTIDTISRGTDASGKRTERQTARTQRQQAAADKRTAAQVRRDAVQARRSKKPKATPAAPAASASATPKPHGPSSTSGGGASHSAPKPKGPAKPAPAPKADPAATEALNLTTVADATGLGDNLANLNQFSAGKPLRPQDVAYLVSQGLLEQAADAPRQTALGKALLNAAKKGDTQSARDALSRARESVKTATKAADYPDQSQFAGYTMDDWDDTKPDSFYKDSRDVKPFSVYKDAAGRDRWLSITTSAYEDSDREWISTKAIAKAVAVGDLTQQRGPLRYWHVPGMDFGDCDFQAAMGPGDRFLVESGTFRSKAAARFGRTLAERGYQMSPGFLHARNQPQAGVFDDIVIYERSPVPSGRAANPFTRFATQEDRMLTAEKETELRGLLADQPDLLKTLLAQVDTTDKAAQAAGVTHKETEQPPAWFAPVLVRLDALEATTKATNVTNIVTPPNTTIAPGTIAQFMNGQWVPTVKAAPPFAAADEGTPEEEASETPDEAMAEGDDTSGADENMLTPTEIQSIAAAAADATVAKLMAALGPLLDLEKKMQGHVQTMMAPLQAQKDDAATKQAEKIATLETQLKEVAKGNLPASLFDAQLAGQMHRPSQSLSNLSPADAKTVKEALNTAQAQPSSTMTPEEQGAYTLIFGQ